MAVVAINKAEFEGAIAKGLCVVDFWAAWCGPCRMVAPVLDALAEKHGETVKVYKVDVDTNQELAAQFGIMTIPTVILFRDGVEVDKRIGVHPLEEFENMILSA
jgi:thioredoxin 1